MKRHVFLFLIAILLSGVCLSADSGKTSIDSLMKQLDEVIANRPTYLRQKETRLQALHARYDSATDDDSRFRALGELFDEYLPFNTDSAYNISLRQEAVALRIGDPALVANARLHRANVLSATGMYRETVEIIDSLKREDIPPYLEPYYFHTVRTVYGSLADFATFPGEKERYRVITEQYRDSLLAINEPGTLGYAVTSADKYNVNGEPWKAIKELNDFISSNRLSEHEMAICAWTLSESYGMTGDFASQKRYLVLSAISDMKASVREYVSLRQLALLLYKEGDLDRAYHFLTIAVDDAAKSNARQRIVELNAYYPMINSIYIEKVHKQQSTLVKAIVIITALSLVLIVLMLMMRKQMARIARARREVEEVNESLNRLNEELKSSNAKLADAYNAIAEISELKETYIGRYMDQCVAYIEKLDSYRKSIGKLVSTGKSDDLKALVKSPTMIDQELKAFYDQFDKTFLSLFPTFVEDLNDLLLPEEAIIPKREGSLTAEQRIFALIRLGISDSDRIARFLRYSLTTIYNYRTKVRNKARGDRNLLETEILKIGRGASS